MATKRFDRQLHILVTIDEHRMLNELAGREGLSPSDMVRQMIRRSFVATFGDGPRAPSPTEVLSAMERPARKAPRARKRK